MRIWKYGIFHFMKKPLGFKARDKPISRNSSLESFQDIDPIEIMNMIMKHVWRVFFLLISFLKRLPFLDSSEIVMRIPQISPKYGKYQECESRSWRIWGQEEKDCGDFRTKCSTAESEASDLANSSQEKNSISCIHPDWYSNLGAEHPLRHA